MNRRLTVLLRSLHEESRSEVERVLDQARREAREILETADSESRGEVQGRLDAARRRAREEVAVGLAEQGGSGRRGLLERRREVLDAILQRARRKLETHSPGPDLSARLAREAVAYLPPGRARLRGGEHALEAAGRAAGERGDLELTMEPDPALPGVLASTPEVEVDATLPALLDARRGDLAVALTRRIEIGEGVPG